MPRVLTNGLRKQPAASRSPVSPTRSAAPLPGRRARSPDVMKSLRNPSTVWHSEEQGRQVIDEDKGFDRLISSSSMASMASESSLGLRRGLNLSVKTSTKSPTGRTRSTAQCRLETLSKEAVNNETAEAATLQEVQGRSNRDMSEIKHENINARNCDSISTASGDVDADDILEIAVSKESCGLLFGLNDERPSQRPRHSLQTAFMDIHKTAGNIQHAPRVVSL